MESLSFAIIGLIRIVESLFKMVAYLVAIVLVLIGTAEYIEAISAIQKISGSLTIIIGLTIFMLAILSNINNSLKISKERDEDIS